MFGVCTNSRTRNGDRCLVYVQTAGLGTVICVCLYWTVRGWTNIALKTTGKS